MSLSIYEYICISNNISETIFYISYSELPNYTILDMIRLNNKCIIAWSSLIIYKNNTATITWIKTKKENRNNGYASKLLHHIIEYCKKIKVSEINLDDMTDNYRKNNNLYIKHGFTHANDYGP
jgi:ribosomal protein S18 acetylase RimI-like enzyme